MPMFEWIGKEINHYQRCRTWVLRKRYIYNAEIATTCYEGAESSYHHDEYTSVKTESLKNQE